MFIFLIILLDHTETAIQNTLMRTIVLVQLYHLHIWPFLLKFKEILNRCTLESVDGLFLISDDKYIWCVEEFCDDR